MRVNQIIGSIGAKRHHTIDRAETSHHIAKSGIRKLGFNNDQRSRILSIVAEMNKIKY
jgi:hypothetical protein